MPSLGLFVLCLSGLVGCLGGNKHNETPNQRLCLYGGGGVKTCVQGGLEAMETGRGRPADEYLRNACIRNDPDACFHLGQFYRSTPKKKKFALKTFKNACFAGSLEGCVIFLESTSSRKVSGDKKIQMMQLYEKACQLSLTKGDHKQIASLCAIAGQDASTYAQDADGFAYADSFLRPACVSGAEGACKTLLRRFARTKPEQTDTQNLQLRKDVCHGRSAPYWRDYCYQVSLMASAGQGMKKDSEIAGEYRDRACHAGLAIACPGNSIKPPRQ